MKKMMIYKLCSALVIASALISCVPQRQYQDVKDKHKKCEEENSALKTQNQDCSTKLTELTDQMTDVKRRITNLQNDTSIQGKSLRLTSNNYDKLYQTYELLLQKNKELLAGNVAENKKLVGDLQLSQEELQKKQDALKSLEKELDLKKKNLDALNIELEQNKVELAKREARVNELQGVLAKKDSTVMALKKKVSDALLGFEGNGLTVQQKNGKVYVSLDEKLLFASGSTVVDPKGVEPLKKLAKVLEQNTDINVLVEGHTDNVPMIGRGEIKDNWDLSAMRATSVVKIIVNNSKVDAVRLTAAGRGEFFPLDASNTAEARKKNRRTEIILTPKLDEILKVLETN
jgi:chemotaxis protein MotB